MKTISESLRKIQKGQGGFTLIELLVVVAILGVIAAVVILNVGGFIGSGTEESANTEAHQVATAAISCLANSTCKAHFQAGVVGPALDGTNGTWEYLLNPGILQATYNVTSTGKITGAATIAGSKWAGCNWTNSTWVCP
jgi:type IV pilus assembly protein PilA